MTATTVLEQSLDKLAIKLEEFSADHAPALQPICDALEVISARSNESNEFKKNIKELAEAVIEVRTKAGAPSCFNELPVPPYDLWLPFKASDLTPADAEDLSAPGEMLNHKVTAMKIAVGCVDNSCDSQPSTD